MPQTSHRSLYIQNLRQKQRFLILLSALESHPKIDPVTLTFLEQTTRNLQYTVTHRYVQQRTTVPKSLQFRDELLPHLDNNRFKQELRCSPEAFHAICDMIKFHPVFHQGGLRPQLDVQLQLAIFLYRAGSFGNSAAIGKISDISELRRAQFGKVPGEL